MGTFDFAAGAELVPPTTARRAASRAGRARRRADVLLDGGRSPALGVADSCRRQRLRAGRRHDGHGARRDAGRPAGHGRGCGRAAYTFARWVSVGGDRSLEMRLSSSAVAHALHGRCELNGRRGFGAGTRLLVQIVQGEQPLYQLGVLTVLSAAGGGDANATDETSSFALPDLHQLLEHCSSCTLHAGGYEVRLAEEVEERDNSNSRPSETPVVSRPIHIGW